LLLDRVSAVNATDPYYSKMRVRRSIFRLPTHWPHWLHLAEWGQKIFARSVRKLILISTLSFKMLPLLLNVVHWYFSKYC